MSHLTNIYDEAGWKKANGYPEGTEIKILRDKNGSKTVLLKLHKGFYMKAHSHMYNEQHLVLDGEYESEGEVYSSGTYRLINIGNDHGSFTSKTGAIVLVIWDPIK